MYVGSPNPPPRMSLRSSFLSFQHHSLTFPAMSYVPYALTAPAPPTGIVPAPVKLLPGTTTTSQDLAARFQW